MELDINLKVDLIIETGYILSQMVFQSQSEIEM